MTYVDKASDPNLTEEAYARSIGKAVISAPKMVDDEQVFMYKWRKAHPRFPHDPISHTEEGRRLYEELLLDYLHHHEVWHKFMEGYLAWRQKQVKLDKAGNNGSQLGPREFTFTYGEHFDDPEEAKRVMSQAIDRLTRYYKDEIIEFHAVGEYTQAGRPHIHGWYHLENGLKITDKNFKRAYPPWNPKRKLGRGFEGGHHATIERVSDFHGYSEKHLEEAWLVKDITNDANDSSHA